MNIFYVLLLGFAVSMDGFVAGVAYGLKNIKMPLPSLVIVGIITSIMTGIAMASAYLLGQFLNTHLAIAIGAVMLVLLGLWSLFQQYLTRRVPSYESDGQISARQLTLSLGNIVISIMAKPETADIDKQGSISALEAVFLGIAVGLDAMVGTFAAALTGILPLYTPLAVALIHMLCLACGSYSSAHFVSDKIKRRIPYLPGCLLMLLGLLRLG